MNIPLSFWDNMAKTYPRYNDASMQRDVTHVIQWAQSKGVCFEKQSILDIGCGTGTFTIPLALKNANIMVIDLCEGMLEALREDAQMLNLTKNIQIHQSGWDDFELKQTFDIVLASMTPAISSESLMDKMICATHDKGLYVGWGRYKKNAFLDALLSVHSIPEKKGGGCIKVAQFIDYLESKKISCEYEYFETSWNESYTYEEAMNYAINQLEGKKIVPDKAKIDTVIKEYEKEGTVVIATYAEKGIVLFSKARHLEMYGCCPKNF